MEFPESKSIAWKTFAEMLGITLNDVISGTPSASTVLFGDGSWKTAAATSADYLVKTSDASLSGERVVTDTATVTWDWSTAGQAKANAKVPYTDKASNFDVSGAPAGFKITGNSVTGTLPASPANEDTYWFVAATASITGCVIGRNGNTIMGSATDMTVNVTSFFFGLIYHSATTDWRLI